MSAKPVTACLLIIGNEILSGRTQDKNLAFIGQELNDLGIRLMEVRVIPDVEAVIVETLNEVRRRFNYVFTDLLAFTVRGTGLDRLVNFDRDFNSRETRWQ